MYSASISARVNPHWTKTHTKIGRKSSRGRGSEEGGREGGSGGEGGCGREMSEGAIVLYQHSPSAPKSFMAFFMFFESRTCGRGMAMMVLHSV